MNELSWAWLCLTCSLPQYFQKLRTLFLRGSVQYGSLSYSIQTQSGDLCTFTQTNVEIPGDTKRPSDSWCHSLTNLLSVTHAVSVSPFLPHPLTWATCGRTTLGERQGSTFVLREIPGSHFLSSGCGITRWTTSVCGLENLLDFWSSVPLSIFSVWQIKNKSLLPPFL